MVHEINSFKIRLKNSCPLWTVSDISTHDRNAVTACVFISKVLRPWCVFGDKSTPALSLRSHFSFHKLVIVPRSDAEGYCLSAGAPACSGTRSTGWTWTRTPGPAVPTRHLARTRAHARTHTQNTHAHTPRLSLFWPFKFGTMTRKNPEVNNVVVRKAFCTIDCASLKIKFSICCCLTPKPSIKAKLI